MEKFVNEKLMSRIQVQHGLGAVRNDSDINPISILNICVFPNRGLSTQ